ncbi:MAG: His-Xaa-Ser system protein HxsD [Rhodospirillales bacterium]|nr:MAG: His-Xaa-Ser system protein HxsD [Rhodospirillales bacterium]
MDDPLIVTFDAALFAESAVKKAAYTLAATASVEIRREGTDWICSLRFLRPTPPAARAEAGESLRIEVLDQDLRERIASETAAVRNTILAVAFSRTGLQSDG